MNLTARTIGAGTIAAASLLAMAAGCFSRSTDEGIAVTAKEPRASTPTNAPAILEEWIPVGSPTIREDIRSSVSAGMSAIIEGGMTSERSAQLETDLATILTSLFTPDFDLYDKLLNTKGCQLDTIADGFSNAVIDWKLYPDDVPELAANAATKTRVKYLWNHPDERNFRWSAFRPASTTLGFGMVFQYNSPEWPHQGVYSQLSLYIPSSGRLREADGERLSRSKDAVWVMVEGKFASGMRTRMRIELYFDSNASTWIPVYIHLGNDGKHRPFPMI